MTQTEVWEKIKKDFIDMPDSEKLEYLYNLMQQLLSEE